MKLSEYQQLSVRTMPKMVEGAYEFYYDNAAIQNYALGLAGETGEVCDLLKKALHHGHPLNDEELKKELGDVLHYLSGLCTMFGYSLEQVGTLNVEKLMKRYPKGFSEEASRERVEAKTVLDGIYGKDVTQDAVKLFKELSPSAQTEFLEKCGGKPGK